MSFAGGLTIVSALFSSISPSTIFPEQTFPVLCADGCEITHIATRRGSKQKSVSYQAVTG
jgi:hypothetical protein